MKAGNTYFMPAGGRGLLPGDVSEVVLQDLVLQSKWFLRKFRLKLLLRLLSVPLLHGFVVIG
jgi:hypothetical protein